MDITRRIKVAAAALAVGTASVIGAGSALAVDAEDPYLGPTTTVAPEVLNVEEAAVEEEAPEVLSAGAANSAGNEVQGSALAFTGGDALALALIGGVAVIGGAGLLAVRRRSAS